MEKVNRIYSGFSTKGYEAGGGNLTVYNLDCVKEDLLNDIFTIQGERVMMPSEGTRIPIMVFEPGDLESIAIIREDLEKVFDNDPRVELLNLDVLPATDKHAMIAIAKINYIEFNVVDDLRIEITSK